MASRKLRSTWSASVRVLVVLVVIALNFPPAAAAADPLPFGGGEATQQPLPPGGTGVSGHRGRRRVRRAPRGLHRARRSRVEQRPCVVLDRDQGHRRRRQHDADVRGADQRTMIEADRQGVADQQEPHLSGVLNVEPAKSAAVGPICGLRGGVSSSPSAWCQGIAPLSTRPSAHVSRDSAKSGVGMDRATDLWDDFG